MEPRGPLKGSVPIPGDKSISHRALLLNGLANGPSRVKGLLRAEDVAATARALRAFGVKVRRRLLEVDITPPSEGLQEPGDVIDCGNSGTTIRLLSGICSSQPFLSVLTGDASLRKRPMMRVVKPLRRMGAVIDGRSDGDRAPLCIRGGDLKMTHHELAIASAQVKSALMLAGLKSGVAVSEPRQSRDHTERMLKRMGAGMRRTGEGWMMVMPTERLRPVDVEVPGDLSSAAFFLAAAVLVPGSEVYLKRIGINPTRTGVIDALVAMGADLQVYPVQARGPEKMADLLARHGPLVGTEISGDLALRCLDELPILAVVAAFAQGRTVIRDAAELRVKESDRIARTVAGLKAIGVMVEETEDGMIIEGGVAPVGDAEVDATGDHRIAMAFAVAGLVCEGGVTINGAESVRSSYPDFFDHLEKLCQS